MKKMLFSIALFISVSASAQYISEIEYDVPGTDVAGSEFIEVFYPTGTNPNDYSLIGIDGVIPPLVSVTYSTVSTRACSASANPAGQVCVYTGGANSIENGVDGVVLINSVTNTFVQGFSYEGNLTVAIGVIPVITVVLFLTDIGTDNGSAANTSLTDNDGDGIFTLTTSTPGVVAGPLPVELLSFTAARKGNSVALSFATANERNNDYFSIERSQDGVHFAAIGKVNGSGVSDTKVEYSYIDEHPQTGINFYRLQQMGFDGRASYSPIVSVTFGQAIGVLLSPQPVLDRLQVVLGEPTPDAATWQVYDFAGRLLQSGTLAPESTNFEINTAILAEGNYALRLISGQQIVTRPFQKN